MKIRVTSKKGRTWKKVTLEKKGNTLELRVKLEKMGHTWKNWSHLEK